MSRIVPRRRRGGGHRRPLAAATLLVALAATSLVGAGPASGAPDRVAATGGCRAVSSSDAPSGGGPSRATVVVDTGSGPVWSACISFSGTISGVEALERAEAVITDLDPVYDQYTGLGRAICKLRGVGTAPPDCLGKSINSWWVSLNGKVTSVGAGSLQITDGDVEGWRYASGGAAPRAATEGTEAAAAPVVPTTTAPPAPTTQPPGGTTAPTQPGGGSLTGSTKPDGTPVDPTTTRPGETTTTKAGQTTTTAKGQTTTTSEADGRTTQVASADEAGGTDGDGSASGESAAGSAGTTAASTGDGGSGGSSAPAVLGFLAVLAAIGGGTIVIRRRNAASPTGPPTPA